MAQSSQNEHQPQSDVTSLYFLYYLKSENKYKKLKVKHYGGNNLIHYSYSDTVTYKNLSVSEL